jgi:tRNA-specific 2-thiouridylase
VKSSSGKRVLLAMSGGIDSSVAAHLLKKQGYKVVGVTFKMLNSLQDRSIIDARIIAQQLNIPFYVANLVDEFNDTVISFFSEACLVGQTPNPCTFCNRFMKWRYLTEFADKLGIKKVATGHYAKINTTNGRYFLSKIKDAVKDQSYFLWRLSQSDLKRTIFPLADLAKDEVKELARRFRLKMVSGKRESYNVCFLNDIDLSSLIKIHFPHREFAGDIKLSTGEKVGTHDGIFNYTIGQIVKTTTSEKLYVKKIEAETRTVFIDEISEIQKSEFKLNDLNFMKYSSLPFGLRMSVVLRGKEEALPADIYEQNGKLAIKLASPDFSIAPGQPVVIFENNDVIGGGTISD